MTRTSRIPGAADPRGLRTLVWARLVVAALALPLETTEMSLNIGRYIATTMPPTLPPISTIMSGSITEVIASTAVSTSAS